jgi:predicted unusual protein kinase regulating ubiquinone biosynthesis (AarF/ABC1/UbiB family)
MAEGKRPRRRKTAMRVGRVSRTARLGVVGAKAAARWASTYLARGERRAAKREEVVLRTADDVARTMGDMKGVAMKLGQIMSLMGGAVPEEFADRMATLQSNAPPMAFALVEQVFLEEFGKRPRELFARFEQRPFAAASIGQVHRAWLADGTAVAVKVQYPGVREAIDHDLSNLGLMFTLTGMAAKGFDPRPVIRDLERGVRDELDYRKEAANQRRFGAIYAGHPFIRIPRVYDEHSSSRVIVQEFIDGRPFLTARQLSEAERNRVAEIVYRFNFGTMHRFGLFQADPHAGNYLLLADGRVAFVDYGCVVEFAPKVREELNSLIAGVVQGDIERWRRGMEAIGYVPKDGSFTTEELWEHMRIFYCFVEDDVTFTPELAAAIARRNVTLTGETGTINRQLNIPEGMIFTQRINFGLAGLMATLRARGPWKSIIAEYVLDAEPATELGRQEAAWRLHGGAGK